MSENERGAATLAGHDALDSNDQLGSPIGVDLTATGERVQPISRHRPHILHVQEPMCRAYDQALLAGGSKGDAIAAALRIALLEWNR